MNQNSYPGREYLEALRNENLYVDVLNIGSFPAINTSEEERCGGLWTPPLENELREFFTFYQFETLKSDSLYKFLGDEKYDVGIQGGTGILKKKIINQFSIGILNFHPGDLPFYRGCSAPEWQLSEFKPIISTCHFIDEGIDTGPIVAKKELRVSKDSYQLFRASIYPETAKFVVEITKKVKNANTLTAEKQDEEKAKYRPYIGDEIIFELKKRLGEMKA
jgi:methionyl-tRNA formyltransferase